RERSLCRESTSARPCLRAGGNDDVRWRGQRGPPVPDGFDKLDVAIRNGAARQSGSFRDHRPVAAGSKHGIRSVGQKELVYIALTAGRRGLRDPRTRGKHDAEGVAAVDKRSGPYRGRNLATHSVIVIEQGEISECDH